jgi:pyruvate,water dikinase
VARAPPGAHHTLAAALAARPDAERPRNREAANVAKRQAAVAELQAALPFARRPVARLLCRMAVRCVQDLEVGKASFLRTLDGGRCATRLLGQRLVADGRLDDPDDALYLTIDELRAGVTHEHRALVAHRRARRAEHATVELPGTFTGTPVPIVVGTSVDDASDVIDGVAGAPGVAEGRARVVTDPNTAEPLEPGEVLVCRFTDPSWAPMFTLADALVIDIGASASHGAIVARELGVPCVIGTNDGTRRIHDGDWLRVDGSAGRVEVLERAGVA